MKIKNARKAAGAIIAAAGWALEMGAIADGNREETWNNLIQESESEKNLAGMKVVYQAKAEWKENETRELGAVCMLSEILEKLEKGMNVLLAAKGLAAPEEVKKK